MKRKELDKKPRTIAQINAAIQTKFPHVCLTRGEGYYYIYSDHDETALMIAGLYQQSVYTNNFRNMSLQEWIEAVERLITRPNVEDHVEAELKANKNSNTK